MDSPVRGNAVAIELARRRFRCKSCKKTFSEPLPDMDDTRQATKRLVQYVSEKALQNTFSSVAYEVGMDETTIRNIFDDHIRNIAPKKQFTTPTWLGIDEVKCSGSFRCILTNVEKLSVFDLHESIGLESLRQYFKDLPNSNQIKMVVMDPAEVFRQVVKECLPGRYIVLDRFHVTKIANEALEKVRRRIWRNLSLESKSSMNFDRHLLKHRKNSLSPEECVKLEVVLSSIPELGDAFEAKEQFCELYEQTNRQCAEDLGKKWLTTLPPSIKKEFRRCVELLNAWNVEIFNYYDYQITNAYTESVNAIIKDIARAGRGYNFEIIRAKLLFNEKSRIPNQQTIRKKVRQEISSWDCVSLSSVSVPQKNYETVLIEDIIEFGPHISMLHDLVDRKQLW